MEIEMGRPPIGKTAMTGAERVRLYRLRHGANKPKPKSGADNAAAKIDALEKELAAAKARIAKLTDEMHEMLAQRFRGDSKRHADSAKARRQ
jgi:hypothetical protein